MSELYLSRNTIHFAEPLPLQSGAILAGYNLVIETYGKLNAEKNPGMTRVLLGDALLQEDDRLQERITQVLDRVEASLKQALRIAQSQGSAWGQAGQDEISIRAAMLMSFVLGRWHRFARSGFKKLPTEASDISLRILLSE